MIQEYLKHFGAGWQNAFTPKLEILIRMFPTVNIVSAIRHFGTLRITADGALDNDQRFVVDCILYKIERESATICEGCGKPCRIAKTEHLPEKKMLCWKCYALEVDAIMSDNTQTQ